MYKLISTSFRGADVENFVNYHRWDVRAEYMKILFELSDKGFITNSDKNKIEYIRHKLVYGGFDLYLEEI